MLKKFVIGFAAVSFFQEAAFAVTVDKFECLTKLVKNNIVVDEVVSNQYGVRESSMGIPDYQYSSASFSTYIGTFGEFKNIKVSYEYNHIIGGSRAWQRNMCESISYCEGNMCGTSACLLPHDPDGPFPGQDWKPTDIDGGIPVFIVSELQPVTRQLDPWHSVISACKFVQTLP